MKWSVVICTHNRSQDLRQTLQRLGALEHPRENFEILVVDNASCDETPLVVQEAARQQGNIRYINEDKLGLSHARNTGIDNSHGEFVAFLDDDAWPEPHWLGCLEEEFNDVRVACVGGKVEPVWREVSGWPDWLHDRLVGYFTVVDAPARHKMHYPAYPAGTNMAFRKSIFSEVGGFSRNLGRAGESLLSGEEVDLCLRIDQADYQVLYTPTAIVHHHVHENRLTQEWVRQRSKWGGISSAVIEKTRFPRTRAIRSSLFYIAFLLLRPGLSLFSNLTGNRKLAFFFQCQDEFCRAYLKQVWG